MKPPAGTVLGLLAVSLLAACGPTADGYAGDPATSASASASASASTTPTPSEAGPAIPGDGTWTVGTDVEPGVYVAEGGEECRYLRLGDLDAEYVDVIVRGFLQRPIIEIMRGDGGFRTQGCGSWAAIEGYSATPADEMAGDGIWLVGVDVEPGTYQAEGGQLCLWQRLDDFEPDLSSVIRGGSSRRATVAADDLAFVTEGCGAWTKVD